MHIWDRNLMFILGTSSHVLLLLSEYVWDSPYTDLKCLHQNLYRVLYWLRTLVNQLLNLWTINLQENESNSEVGLCSGISRTMYNEHYKFETHLITTLIFIHLVVIQQCYNKENSNRVAKIRIYQLKLTEKITRSV